MLATDEQRRHRVDIDGRLRSCFPEPAERFWGYDVRAVVDLAAKVKAAFTTLEDPAFRAAMMDFDDRDLARLTEGGGV
jgi:hypothetical protein